MCKINGVWCVMIHEISVWSWEFLFYRKLRYLKRRVHYLWATISIFLGQSSKCLSQAKPEPGENKAHSGVFGPGTQPKLELEQPKLLTCGPTKAMLMNMPLVLPVHQAEGNWVPEHADLFIYLAFNMSSWLLCLELKQWYI